MRNQLILLGLAVFGGELNRAYAEPSLAINSTPAMAKRLVEAAEHRTTQRVQYDGRYLAIDYPMGDVPAEIGVCTDVVIRSYRQLGIDLQQLVHEDMRAGFDQYPTRWGLTKPDANIDHRRVPNLETFFTRHGQTLPPSEQAQDYSPGDIVSWRLPNNLPHIGIVSRQKVAGTDRYEVIHNIGRGPRSEDMLFAFDIVGHYRFQPAHTDPPVRSTQEPEGRPADLSWEESE